MYSKDLIREENFIAVLKIHTLLLIFFVTSIFWLLEESTKVHVQIAGHEKLPLGTAVQTLLQ